MTKGASVVGWCLCSVLKRCDRLLEVAESILDWISAGLIEIMLHDSAFQILSIIALRVLMRIVSNLCARLPDLPS